MQHSRLDCSAISSYVWRRCPWQRLRLLLLLSRTWSPSGPSRDCSSGRLVEAHAGFVYGLLALALVLDNALLRSRILFSYNFFSFQHYFYLNQVRRRWKKKLEAIRTFLRVMAIGTFKNSKNNNFRTWIIYLKSF